MPPQGHQKNQKRIFIELICEILITEGAQIWSDVDYKLRLDARWRAMWEQKGLKIPKPGTIKNYVSDARGLLSRTGSDRPWSILASSDPQSRDFIPANDIPLILEIWRIWLAHGNQLTLRQARWVSRLRHTVPYDTGKYRDLGQLFRMATRYASREIALGQRGMSEDENSTEGSIDLDAEIAFSHMSTPNQQEQNALKISGQAAVDSNLISSTYAVGDMQFEWLWYSEILDRMFDEIGLPHASRDAIGLLPAYAAAGLSSVLISVIRKPKWDVSDVDSQRLLVEQVVNAVSAEDWELVAHLADMRIQGLNVFETREYETRKDDE
jgi:hypothetical protein